MKTKLTDFTIVDLYSYLANYRRESDKSTDNIFACCWVKFLSKNERSQQQQNDSSHSFPNETLI